MKSKIPFVIIGLVGIAAIIGAILYANSASTPTTVKTNRSSTNTAAPKTTANAVPGAEPAWSKGSPSATVTLEEFADFQCPACAGFSSTLQELKTVYGDRVRVVFRQFPLSQIHPKAYDAARAAEAAGSQGKFWEMHDLLFQRQKDWSVMPDHRKVFSGYAQNLGLNVAQFENDIIGDRANARVAADMKRGSSLGIGGTPSVFLNGRPLLPEEMTTNRMRQLIDAELQNKK